MTSQEITEVLDNMSILSLEPGDMLVLMVNKKLSDAAFARLAERMKELSPNHKVMILDEGLQLGVMRGG